MACRNAGPLKEISITASRDLILINAAGDSY
jgi:hypothetical protein